MPETKQIITGDSQGAQKAYADLARQVVKLEEANQRLASKIDQGMKKGGDGQARMNSLVDQGIDKAAGLALQWASIATAIRLASQELETYHRLNKEALDTNVSVGDAQAEFIKNTASSSSAEKRASMERIAQLQRETKFQNLPQMYLAAAEGASASGGNIPATESALRAAIPLARHRPEDLKTLVGGALDLQKASGITDAKKNLSFLAQVGEQSRVEGLRNTALSVAPAVSTAAKTVTSDQRQATIDAGAFFAALSNEGVDPTGETTRNAVQVISGELRSFFQQGVKVNVPGRSRPLLIKPKEDPNTIEGRIRVLQEDPRLRKAFMESANFGRERFRIPFEQLVNKGQTATAFDQARRKLSFDDKAYTQMVQELEGLTPQIALSNAQKKSQGASQSLEVAQQLEAQRAVSRENTLKALEKTTGYSNSRMPWLTRTAGPRWGFNALEMLPGADPESVGIGALKTRQKEIVQGNSSWLMRMTPLPKSVKSLLDPLTRGRDKTRDELSDEQRRDYDSLQEQIVLLRELRDQMKEMNSRDKQNRPSSAPAARAEAGRQRER